MGNTLSQLIQKVERRLNSAPEVVLMTGAVNDTATTLQLDTGEASKLETGMVLESGLDTSFSAAETMLVRSFDADADTVVVRRGYPDTEGVADHDANTFLRLNPRFTLNHIRDVVLDVVRSKLQPWVWNVAETTLTWESDGHLSPAVNDVLEPRYVYQVIAGQIYPIPFQWLSPDAVDATNFPNGCVIINSSSGSSTVYMAYKGRVSVGNNSDPIDGLTVLGAVAYLQMGEESPLLGPDVSMIASTVPAGSRVSAGRQLMAQFELERSQEANRLSALDANVPQFVPAPGSWYA